MKWPIFKASFFAIIFLVPFMAMAQSQSPPPAANQQLLKSEELGALVAPIALYPDAFLAEVLMAATYPLEVVQAERWISENKKLKGRDLKAAVDKQKWDDSVKTLLATPSVLTMMSSKLDWTQKLGDSVLAQQAADPAEYRNFGVMTFIVSHNGTVFQKDLGPHTARLAERMASFNPDESWKKVDVPAPVQ